MNKEQVIAWAREAGFTVGNGSPALEKLERFAALVAAAEREKCAYLCLDKANAPPGEGREMALFCAAAIRARSME